MKKTSCSGPLYKHLGHFAQQKYLDKGHNNDMDPDSGKEKLEYGGGSSEERAERAKQAERGFQKAASDNPVSKAIKWMTGSK